MDVQKLIEEVKGMTVLELNELVKALEAEFGVSAAAPVAAAGAAGAAEAAPAAEEKTEFDVVLKDIGPNKIAIIKVVREATGLGLADAKKAVEAMGVIKENAPKADAEALVAKLKENGATAEHKYAFYSIESDGRSDDTGTPRFFFIKTKVKSNVFVRTRVNLYRVRFARLARFAAGRGLARHARRTECSRFVYGFRFHGNFGRHHRFQPVFR